ncbi:MAG TPA: helix-hairpin-helix domain-containing protein [Steroidobacteraceae bacterium]|nr:helix-hairpin-helix domain-containing protein [Steroidobacteraceae bacterium]
MKTLPSTALPLNTEIAARLEEVAQILAGQNANPYRLAAYRAAARTLRSWPQPISEVVNQEGVAGLRKLPGIGERLARAVYQLVLTGRLPMLERLRGDSDPVELLASVPGIGAKTAQHIHERLGIDTLEELECAAHDGRLERLGMGAKRLSGVRDALAGRLGRAGQRPAPELGSAPDIAEVLDVDRQYREEAGRGSLPRIAPRRFNPRHEAWLPVLHARRGGREYTALFSNTARAHELARTRDWVVLYYDGAGAAERQCTVITAERGPLRGQRIVRGREDECLGYYARAAGPPAASPP